MNQRFLMWGLASIVFVVTLGISSWHAGLWTSDEPAVRHARPGAVASEDMTPMPVRPFGPEKSAPTVAPPPVAAATPQSPLPPPPAQAPPPIETPPQSTAAVPDLDEADFRAHEERVARQGSRER
jgi:hypothetical protein